MTALDGLLASYLDLARHLDPLRHPFEAPSSLQHALGRFDAPWLHAQVVALRAIANAVEDLDEVEVLEDEVDRTMLIDMIRADALRLEASVGGELVDPVAPLGHAVAALDMLMEERFTGNEEAALRDRVAALPELLAALCNDSRAVPEHLVGLAQLELAALAEAVDEASERLDDAAVQPALAAIGDCRQWLDDPTRRTATAGLSEAALDGILSTLVSEPVGHRGTLRLLELRRAGVERSLAGAAEELGSDDGLSVVRALREERVSRDDADAAWHADWLTGARFSRDFYRDIDLGSASGPDAKRVWELSRHRLVLQPHDDLGRQPDYVVGGGRVHLPVAGDEFLAHGPSLD